MEKRQIDSLSITKTEYGGYVVCEAGLELKPIFCSKDLEECFSFVKESITFDDKSQTQTRMLFE